MIVSDILPTVLSCLQTLFALIAAKDVEGIIQWISTADLLCVNIIIMIAFSTYAFFGSILTGDYSYVDRQWSITPVIYCLVFASRSLQDLFLPSSQRTIIIAILVYIWGFRLSYNFWRKGGYSGEEDYRWAELRKVPMLKHPLIWHLFNFSFIAIFQHALLLAITLPAYLVSQSNEQLQWSDLYACFGFVCFLAIETIADQQQWKFQNKKYKMRREGQPLYGDYALGFLTSGLFKYSRHPNFFSEQSIWVCVYLFSIGATNEYLNWSIVGCLTLIALFQGSTCFTEAISTKKYPRYTEYTNTTSRLLPWFPGPRLSDKSDKKVN